MPKIMLLEDDRDMYSLLSTLLELEGYEVIQAGEMEGIQTVEDMIRLVRQESPTLVLMDVYMDQIDGFELLHALRQEPELSQMHILMSSGIDFSERAKREGADGFLLKPYMPEELIQRVRAVLAEGSSIT
jgi:DNA-binding response OmpR family regulator